MMSATEHVILGVTTTEVSHKQQQIDDRDRAAMITAGQAPPDVYSLSSTGNAITSPNRLKELVVPTPSALGSVTRDRVAAWRSQRALNQLSGLVQGV